MGEGILHEAEVRAMLCSGVSPARVVRLLELLYGEAPSVEAVREYSKGIPKEEVIPPSGIQQRYRGVDVRVDAPVQLGRLLKLMEDRLDALLLTEGTLPQAERLSMVPVIERVVEQYRRLLLDYVRVCQSVGELPSKPVEYAIVARREEEAPQLSVVLSSGKLLESGDTIDFGGSEDGVGGESCREGSGGVV